MCIRKTLFLLLLVAGSVSALTPRLTTSYSDTAGACSTEGISQLIVDSSDTSRLIVSSFTDDVVSIFNVTNSSNVNCTNGYTDSAPSGSIDGINRSYYNSTTKILYAPSSVDDVYTILNMTTWTPVAMGSIAVAKSTGTSSLDGVAGVSVFDVGNGNVYAAWATYIDDTVAVYNVSNPAVGNVTMFAHIAAANPCSADGITQLTNILGTNYTIGSASVDDTLSVWSINSTNITCVTNYTDSATPNSIDGIADFFYENSTGLVYVPSGVDSEFTILNLSNPTSIVAVGSVGSITNAQTVALYTEGSTKYAVVGSGTKGVGLFFINVTNPASPVLAKRFNATDGSCTWNATTAMAISGDILYTGGGVTASGCLMVLNLSDAGYTYTDVINGTNLTPVGTPVCNQSGVCSFNGVDDGFDVGGNVTYTSNWTESFWFMQNVSSCTEGDPYFGRGYDYRLFLLANCRNMTSNTRNSTAADRSIVANTKDINKGLWHNAIYTFNDSDDYTYVYIDGVYVDRIIMPDLYTGSTAAWQMGYNSLIPVYTNGNLSDVRFFNVPANDSIRAALLANSSTACSNLIHWWPFKYDLQTCSEGGGGNSGCGWEDCIIDCSTNHTISDAVDYGGYNVHFSGSGSDYVIITAPQTNIGRITFDCRVSIDTGGNIRT